MNLFTVNCNGGVPVIEQGLTFKPDEQGIFFLNDSLIELELSSELEKPDSPEDENTGNLYLIECGYVNLNTRMVEPSLPADEIIVHIKVRTEREDPLCEIVTRTCDHFPLLQNKTDPHHKSLLFLIRNGEYVTLEAGRLEYSLMCLNGRLQVFDMKDPFWPPEPTAKPTSSRKKRRIRDFFSRISRIFSNDPFPEREIFFVHAR